MKKFRVSESENEKATATSASSTETRAAASSELDRSEGDDPMSGLQADLDRFRDLALRSQADFENYKKRCAREKDEAIKYANGSLLERLIPIVDNFELGLSAARSEGEQSPIYSGMSLVLKQLNDFLTDNG
jgi:molecular chaperone GrpE